MRQSPGFFMPVRRELSDDDLVAIRRLYIKKKFPLKKIAQQFRVGDKRLSAVFCDLGIKMRHTGGRKISVCQCGKPAVRKGRCGFHFKHWVHDIGRRYDRRDEVLAMCERLVEALRSHPDEQVGVMADSRKSRYGSNVAYFWQGEKDRSPEQLRRLGSVPDRVSLRTSRMLLKVLVEYRRRR